MNVLFVNATHGWAGIKTWMVELGAFLSRRGHTVHAACRPGNAMRPACERLGFPCHEVRFGPDFSPPTIWRFVRLLRALRTDVIVTNVSRDIRTAGVAARLLKVAHVNRLGSRDRIPIRARLVYDLTVDRVFVPSRGLLAHYEQYPTLRGKLRQFPNAVVPRPWREPRNGPPRFAVLARLTRRKQIDEVLRVFARVQDLPWELHVGGTGPELPALRRLAASLGLSERVRFTFSDTDAVARIDAPAFLRDKDAGILYSRSEPFGWAILEYLAASCAVIAPAVDGPQEIIRDGIDGLLVDPSRAETLESAVRALIVSPPRREELARNGHARVCREFHQDIVFPRVEQALLEVVAERR